MPDGQPEEVRERVARYAQRTGGLLAALRDIVHTQGYIRDPDVATVADVFNLSRAEVRGVVSFYRDLHTEPPARNTLEICRAEACQATGGRALAEELKNRLGIVPGQTTPDGRVALRPVYCLGLCACGPAMRVNGRLWARCHHHLDDIVGELR